MIKRDEEENNKKDLSFQHKHGLTLSFTTFLVRYSL